MITSKAIHGMAPSYLSNLICIRSSSRYSLRNNDTIFLERPKGFALQSYRYFVSYLFTFYSFILSLCIHLLSLFYFSIVIVIIYCK